MTTTIKLTIFVASLGAWAAQPSWMSGLLLLASALEFYVEFHTKIE